MSEERPAPRPSASPRPGADDEWRYWFKEKLTNTTGQISELQAQVGGMKNQITLEAQQLRALIDLVQKRIDPLEKLRSMVMGAAVVLVALAPLVWWLLVQAAQLTTKSGGKP